MGATQQDRAERFAALHRRGEPLRLLNAWDAGSARLFAARGAPALGTTSAGIAYALGRPDGERLDRDEMLAAVRAIAGAVDVPVSADLEAGYAGDAAGVQETVALAIAAGAVGVNLEDGRGDRLAPVEEHAERVRAAVRAGRDAGVALFVNARTDTLFLGLGDEDETVARVRAYAEAGADGVFVPGAARPDTIRRLAEAVDVPLNVLALPGMAPVPELGRLGVARVSVGSGPSRVALGALAAVADEVLGPGTFERLGAGAIPYAEANRLFAGGRTNVDDL